MIHTQSSGDSLLKSYHKDNRFAPQLQIVKDYLYDNIASRYMTANIDALRDLNSIAVIRKDRCRISGEMVEFLSTDPQKFPEDPQMKLFNL